MLCFSHWLLNLEWRIVSDQSAAYVITDKHTSHDKYRTRTSNQTLSPPWTLNCECMALGQANTTVNTLTEPPSGSAMCRRKNKSVGKNFLTHLGWKLGHPFTRTHRECRYEGLGFQQEFFTCEHHTTYAQTHFYCTTGQPKHSML